MLYLLSLINRRKSEPGVKKTALLANYSEICTILFNWLHSPVAKLFESMLLPKKKKRGFGKVHSTTTVHHRIQEQTSRGLNQKWRLVALHLTKKYLKPYCYIALLSVGKTLRETTQRQSASSVITNIAGKSSPATRFYSCVVRR